MVCTMFIQHVEMFSPVSNVFFFFFKVIVRLNNLVQSRFLCAWRKFDIILCSSGTLEGKNTHTVQLLKVNTIARQLGIAIDTVVYA